VCPGNQAIYDLDVVNATGLEQSFSLEYSSPWPVDGPPETGVVPDLMTGTVSISALVPWYAATMESGDVTVTAAGADGASAEAHLVTMAALGGGYRDRADLPEGRRTRDHALVYDNNRLYRIGGHDGVVRASLDIYDVETDMWSQGAEMPGPRTWIDAVAMDGRIYVAGGWSTYATSSLYIYDIGSGAWTSGAAMPQARFAYAGVALGGKYYVIGGTDGSAYQDTLWSYDPATDTWDTGLPSMGVPRRYPLAGVIGGKIYVTGGMSSNVDYVKTSEVYDPETNGWSYAAPLPADGWVRAADGVLSDRYLLLVGGASTDVTASASGLAYDALEDRWGWLPKMSHLLYALEGDGDGSRFWFVSGRLYENETWSYSPYATALLPCPACDPVHDAGFSWEPSVPAAEVPVQFSAAASGSRPIEYAWEYGDGGTGSGNPVVHTYSAPGVYTVTMTASNCGQQVVEQTIVVVVGSRLFLPVILREDG
jgi:PKD repeat protein